MQRCARWPFQRLHDRSDVVGDEARYKKGEVDEAPDIATGDAAALGQFPQRSGAPGGKLLENPSDSPIELTAPVAFKRRGIEMRLVLPGTNDRSKSDPTLIKAIARGRAWFVDACAAGHWRERTRRWRGTRIEPLVPLVKLISPRSDG